MKKFNLIDLIIIIFFSIFSIVGLFYGVNTKSGKYVLILSPQGEYSYSLEKDRIIYLKGKVGDFIIQIKDNKVSVIETHCPKQICQRFTISKANESITCPPNMIVIKIIGEEEANIDGITE